MACLLPADGAEAAPSGGATAAPLGRLVSVGNHRLHLYCTGQGTPTVVLEAGIGANHLDWIRVQPEVSKTTRVCSYDRAGYGWSEAGPAPRSAKQISGELSRLLHNVGIDGPIVLVGHSFGGVLSIYYASRFAGQVAGLILVDSMHPDQFARFEEAGIDVPVEPASKLIRSSPRVLTFGIPVEYRALARHLARQGSVRAAIFDELGSIALTMTQVKAGARSTPPRVEVILHGRREWDRIYRDGRMENLWIRLQADLANRLGAPRLVVASRSGHQVPLEDPMLIEKMVRWMVRNIRAESY